MLVLLLLAAPAAADGPETFADRLAEITRLFEDGAFDEADLLARDLLPDARSAFGRDSKEVARTLDRLVLILYRNGGRRLPTTLALARTSLSIWEVRDPEGEGLAAALHWLAVLVHGHRRYDEALELFRRSLAIRTALHGESHPAVAETYDYLGELYLDLAKDDPGMRQRAEQAIHKALDIRREVLGPETLPVATSWNSLVRLYYSLGDFERGRECAQKSLDIRAGLLDESHPLVGRSWHNLAVMDHTLGRIAEARSGFETALRIRTEALGEGHPEVGSTHSALASLLRDAGDFTAAEEHYRAALTALDRGYGSDHPRYATGLSNLALLLEQRGDFEQARELQEASLAIRMDSDREGKTRAWLGRLAWVMGEAEEARQLLEQGLAQQELRQGDRHPDLADTLLSLAELELSVGAAERAGALYGRASDVLVTLDAMHPRSAEVEVGLARVDRTLGRERDAIGHADRALEILEANFGPDHPRAPEALLQRAGARAALGDRATALQDALSAYVGARRHLRLVARLLPERAALAYLASLDGGLDLALSILAGSADAPTVAATWDALIEGRALVFDEIATRRRSARLASLDEFKVLSQEFVRARTRLANLLTAGGGKIPAAVRREQIRTARDAAETAEAALADIAASRDGVEARQAVDLVEIRHRLGEDSALVAFVLFDRVPLEKETRSEPSTGIGRPSYGAFLYAPASHEPAFFALGGAVEVDRLVDELRVSALGALFGDAREELRYERVGGRLRELVWDPLSTLVSSSRTVFVVADGSLALMSLAALPSAGGGYLVETGARFHLLTAERDLLRRPSPERGEGILLVGGVDFDTSAPGTARRPAGGSRPPLPKGARSACLDDLRPSFEPLPSTLEEVSDLVQRWRRPGPSPGPVTVLSGQEAHEARFKALAPGHAVLHLSTHGFFYGAQCGRELVVPDAGRTRDAIGNPLAISGLAFAGANARQAVGKDSEDGILTAEEVAAMDLAGVSWAVLSACDTGTGTVQAGEGVLGLRRAFRIAGVESVIMSLWPVEDASARDWMAGLYQARLEGGAETAEAVHQATLSLLESRRRQGLSTHPAFWGSFVAAGEWR